MAQLHPPQRGGAPPYTPQTEVSYTSYSPSPSSVEALNHRFNRINEWTTELPQKAARPGVSPTGISVGAGSATWSDDLGTVTEEGGAQQPRHGTHLLPRRPPNGTPYPQSPRSPAPSVRARGPPVPLLAQTPQHAQTPVEQHRGDQLARAPSFHPKVPPSAPRSARSAREAYLNSALELPLDMLTEVAAPNEVFDPDYASKPGRMGSILGRARSTVSLRGAAAAALPQHPAPVPPNPMSARPRGLSHSQLKPTSRRHSQQSLRSVPEMHILPKLVSSARPSHLDASQARPSASQSPTPSYEDSKCSSLQTSSDEHSIVRAPEPAPPPSAQPTIVNLHFDELNVTSKGVSAKGVAVQSAPVLAPAVVQAITQDPIPPSQLARRTTSRAHRASLPSAPPPAPVVGDGRVEQLATTDSGAEARDRKDSIRTDRRPALLKSASVDGPIHSAPRAFARAPSSASERSYSEPGVIFTRSSAQVNSVHDNGDHITFEVPSNRRGKLHVSLAWLPGRNRGARSQPSPARPQALASGPNRRSSVQGVPSATVQPRPHRRSHSLSGPLRPTSQGPVLPSQLMSAGPAPVMHGAPAAAGFAGPQQMPPQGIPYPASGTIPGQAPGAVPVGAQAAYPPPPPGPMPMQPPGSLPSSVRPGMPPQANGLPPGAQLGGYPIQPMYPYPGVQPIQPGIGMAPAPGMAPWPGYAGQPGQQPPARPPPPAPTGSPSRTRGLGLGLGPSPSRPTAPTRAATLPAPSTPNRFFKMWPFNRNTANDAFANRPAGPASTKQARFAEPLVIPRNKSQKELARERRAERRDKRERRRSGDGVGVNVKVQDALGGKKSGK